MELDPDLFTSFLAMAMRFTLVIGFMLFIVSLGRSFLNLTGRDL